MATTFIGNERYGHRLSAEQALEGLRIIFRHVTGTGQNKRVVERTGLVHRPVDRDLTSRIGHGLVTRMLLVDAEPQIDKYGSTQAAGRHMIYADAVAAGRYEIEMHPDQAPGDSENIAAIASEQLRAVSAAEVAAFAEQVPIS